MSSRSDENVGLFEEVDERALAGADFAADIIGELRRAFETAQHTSNITQTEIADRLEVSKSSVHRWLRGDANMTLRKLGELIWAMKCDAKFTMTSHEVRIVSPSVTHEH